VTVLLAPPNPVTEPTYVAVIAVLDALPVRLTDIRTEDNLTVKVQADLIGIGSSTLTNFATSNYTKATLGAVLTYLASG
jgi:acetamidase/formamidase